MSWEKITSNFLFVYGFFFFVQCGNKSKSYISTSQSITKSFQGRSEGICISWPTVGCAMRINHLSLSMFITPLWLVVQGYGFCGKIPRPSRLFWHIFTGQHLQKDLSCVSGMHDILAAK